MGELVSRFQNARTKLFRRHSTQPNPSGPRPTSAGDFTSPSSRASHTFAARPPSRLRTAPEDSSLKQAASPQNSDRADVANKGKEESPLPAQEIPPSEPILDNSVLTLEEPSPPIQTGRARSRSIVNTDGSIGTHVLPPTPFSEDEQTQQSTTTRDIKGKGKAIEVPLSPDNSNPGTTPAPDYFGQVNGEDTETIPMARRRIWIKRPGDSATLVQALQDDMVDDVRDMVLRKYANSLGRSFDAPDVTIRILPRERTQQERCLSPDEPICRVLDAYFPGGQSVEEALLIEVPHKRQPRQSPRVMNHMTHYFDDNRPVENEGDYFPPMPLISPNLSNLNAAHDRPLFNQPVHSMAILETGQLPALPSPRERKAHHRPKYSRQHTSSPTIISGTSRKIDSVHPSRTLRPPIEADPQHITRGAPTPPPLPTSPLVTEGLTRTVSVKASTPPLERIMSPRPPKTKRARRSVGALDRPQPDGRKGSDKQPTYAFLEGIVPPINVLIVEDNPINLRLLEMFAKRLKVRWQTAMNGKEAVLKWRTGGFHLVLMDIQLPIMNGLEATKEIRRLERVNGIGVFAKSEGEDGAPMSRISSLGLAGDDVSVILDGTVDGEDRLSVDGIFKSPVIIVALTASSLQSDRHEALAAGCNDFLTKPVSFVWLERKIIEWGCMQALIDFDGWRKWKDVADEEEIKSAESEDPQARLKRERKEAKRAALMAKMGAA